MAKIVIIGSANIDTTHYLSTEFSKEFTDEFANEILKTNKTFGGKGANQAKASKLQAPTDEVYFIGCVGHDDAGISIIEEFKKTDINFTGIKVLKNQNTDGRIIYVDKNGENRMIGYGNCIKELIPESIDMSILENADIVAIQMKMPPETVNFIIEYCNKNNKTLIVDPTPLEKSAILLEQNAKLLKQCSYLTPNEEEAFFLIKYEEKKDISEIKKEFEETSKEIRIKMIEDFVAKYPNMIVTLGKDGVIYQNHGKVIRKNAYSKKCKDSTGAGDTFNGAFIASIARGDSLNTAIEYSLIASAIKIQYMGAQNGIPTYEETTKFLLNLSKI